MTDENTCSECGESFDSYRAMRVHQSRAGHMDKPWRDEERIQEMYVEKRMSAYEIANFDIAASFNPNRDLDTRDLGVPESFPEYNTGVLVYDTAAVADIFETWANRYQNEHEHDQPSFRRVVYDSDVRIATLTREYNCMIRCPGKVVKPVKLFHGRLLDVDSPGAPKYFDVEEAASNINEYEGHRIYHRGGRIAGFPRLARQLHLFRHSLREEGIIVTARRTLSAVVRSMKHLISGNT